LSPRPVTGASLCRERWMPGAIETLTPARSINSGSRSSRKGAVAGEGLQLRFRPRLGGGWFARAIHAARPADAADGDGRSQRSGAMRSGPHACGSVVAVWNAWRVRR
jgi:hypothetical protein